MSAKVKTRKTGKGGSVRTVAFGNFTVDIYSRAKQGSVRLVEKLYEIKVGETIKTVLLDAPHLEWGKFPRKKKLDGRYSSQC
jgi:hypothetical protein